MFDGSRAQTIRAQLQIALLDAEFKRFLNGNYYVIEQGPADEPGSRAAICRVTKPLPLVSSVVIGEIVHNLRSSLDHAVYELTLMNTGQASSTATASGCVPWALACRPRAREEYQPKYLTRCFLVSGMCWLSSAMKSRGSKSWKLRLTSAKRFSLAGLGKRCGAFFSAR